MGEGEAGEVADARRPRLVTKPVQILSIEVLKLDHVCPFIEVLKPRSRLFVCRGPGTQIPSVHLSRS